MNEQRIEVDRLAMEAKNGSQQAKQALYEQCDRLITWLANRIVARFANMNYEDTRQEICLIFARCICSYNPEKGTFRTVFVNSVLNNAPKLSLEYHLIRTPRTLLYYKRDEKRGLKLPKTAEIIYERANGTKQGEPETIETQTPPEIAILNEYKTLLKKALKKLPERSRSIIKYYYGIDANRLNANEIGAKFGITGERVRQIRNAGIKKLQEIMKQE